MSNVYDTVAWTTGPARVYERLAHAVVSYCPVSLEGALVLDAGAGTGVVGDVAASRGARVVGADASWGMLRANRWTTVQADLGALPFRRPFDAALGGCVINHFTTPVPIVGELRSVVRRDGAVVLSSFPRRADPVKQCIDGVATAFGWRMPDWFASIKTTQENLLASIEMFATVGRAGGLDEVHVYDIDVSMAGLTAEDAVAYRLGLGQFRDWIEGRDDVRAAALDAVRPYVATWAMPLLVLTGRG